MTKNVEPDLSKRVNGAPMKGSIISNPIKTDYRIQTQDTKSDQAQKMAMVENPENLTSNLCVDHESTHGWMGAVKIESFDNAPIFQGCKKLIGLLNPPPCKAVDNGGTKSQDLGEDDNMIDDTNETNVGNSHDTEIERLQQLWHVKNIAVVATRAINEVLKMTDAPKRDYGKQKDRNNRKQKPRKNQEDGFIVHNDSRNSNGKNNQVIVPECATLRSIKSFNTLCIIIPILESLLNHPERKNSNIEMRRGPSLSKPTKTKKGKKQLYLFGSSIYSIVSYAEYDQLQRDLLQLMCTCSRSVCSYFESAVTNIDENIIDQLHKDAYDGSRDILMKVVPQILKERALYSPDEMFKKVVFLDRVNSKHTHDEVMNNIGALIDSDLIHPLYNNMVCTQNSHARSVQNLLQTVKALLSSRYPNVQLMIYGSCLSGLSLGMSSDVDISLYISSVSNWKKMEEMGELSQEGFKKKLKNCVYSVANVLRKCAGAGFGEIQPIPQARVPVVKGQYKCAQNPLSNDGSLCFDICFLNEIAVVNSTLLREYSLLEVRVKMVMLAVKSWVKSKDIGSAADGTMSSYTWMVLVIFYLQCIGFVPCLQCPHFLKVHGVVPDASKNRWDGINGLNTAFVTSLIVQQRAIWKTPKRFLGIPVSFLLSGFFTFYAYHFPYQSTAASIRLGRCMLQKTVFQSARLWRMCIEDPFETHDSNCPHDLGIHLSLTGQAIVLNELKNAAEQMSTMFANNTVILACFRNYFNLLKLQSNDPKRESDVLANGDKRYVHNKRHSRQNKMPQKDEVKNQYIEDTLTMNGGHTKDRVKDKSQQQKNVSQKGKGKAYNRSSNSIVFNGNEVMNQYIEDASTMNGGHTKDRVKDKSQQQQNVSQKGKGKVPNRSSNSVVYNGNEVKNQYIQDALTMNGGHTKDRVKDKPQQQKNVSQKGKGKVPDRLSNLVVLSGELQSTVLDSKNKKDSLEKQSKPVTNDVNQETVGNRKNRRRRNRRSSDLRESTNLGGNNIEEGNNL